MPPSKDNALRIGKERIYPGERRRIFLNVAAQYDYTQLNIPIEVIRGKKSGPTLFISAAVHGDELNGVEIIKQLLQRPILGKVKGTLILVPIVNVFGFNDKSRYLPDRRDLNRCFPGSAKGSLASQLAHVFMKEVVSKCSHGIDLHTGAIHRSNLPQIRACLDDDETRTIAEAFGAPVMIHSKLRDGSLREAARKKKVSVLLFEGGEALRYDDGTIRCGVAGCLSVMRSIGILPAKTARRAKPKPVFEAEGSYWVRAPHSGTFRSSKRLGDHVQKGEKLAVISDSFGGEPYDVTAEDGGIVIGTTNLPLVNKGDAMFHIATFESNRRVKRAINLLDDITS